MIRIHASTVAAQVVKLKSVWYRALLLFIKDAVGHSDRSAEPQARVAVCLRDREIPATRLNVDHGPDVIKVGRDGEFGLYSSGIFGVRNRFQVIWVHARAILAQVVKFKAIRKLSVSLLPIPYVAHHQQAGAVNARVSVRAMDAQVPAFRGRIYGGFISDYVMISAKAIRRSLGKYALVFYCNSCWLPASTHAQAARIRRWSISCLIVVLQKAIVGIQDIWRVGVGSVDCDAMTAAAHAEPRWIGAARIVRKVYFDSLGDVVAFGKLDRRSSDLAAFLQRAPSDGRLSATTAQAKAGWVRAVWIGWQDHYSKVKEAPSLFDSPMSFLRFYSYFPLDCFRAKGYTWDFQ
jgi:hypothetical protein